MIAPCVVDVNGGSNASASAQRFTTSSCEREFAGILRQPTVAHASASAQRNDRVARKGLRLDSVGIILVGERPPALADTTARVQRTRRPDVRTNVPTREACCTAASRNSGTRYDTKDFKLKRIFTGAVR